MAFERRAELLALLVLSACALYGYLLSVPLFLYLLGTRYWLISVLYLSFLLVDRNVAKNGGRPVAFLKFSSLWRHYANYFPVKLVKTCDLDPSKNYIFGYHPHGILGIAAVINFAMNGTDFRKLFPGITTYTATLKLNFWLPVFRDFLLGIGMVSCSKKSIENICGRHRHGNALTLAIGGAAESYDAHPGSCTLTLKNRKGFIRMALTTGAQLVPVYSFGETDIFRQVGNPPGSLWRSFQEHFHSATGVVPCLFYGRGVLDNSFGLLPLRQQVITVVGTPIPVEQCLEPDDKLVDHYHQKYVDQLTVLFEQYKHLSQHPDGKRDSSSLRLFGHMDFLHHLRTRTASLLTELDKKLLVVLRDGRTLIGYLSSVDQFANLVLEQTIERIHVGKEYGDIERGIFVVRGENVVLLGEIDEALERKLEEDKLLKRVSVEDILEAQRKDLEDRGLLEKERNRRRQERGLPPNMPDMGLDDFQ